MKQWGWQRPSSRVLSGWGLLLAYSVVQSEICWDALNPCYWKTTYWMSPCWRLQGRSLWLPLPPWGGCVDWRGLGAQEAHVTAMHTPIHLEEAYEPEDANSSGLMVDAWRPISLLPLGFAGLLAIKSGPPHPEDVDSPAKILRQPGWIWPPWAPHR